MNTSGFRKELKKIMPGYSWTVHKPLSNARLKATGSQSSGSNRISTVVVVRTECDGRVSYEAKSAGFGLKAPWLYTYTDGTLARALRGLQSHYKAMANTYRVHENDLQRGRGAGRDQRPSPVV